MVTTAKANWSVNISLHVLILFSFLTIFFFTFISHLEKKSIDNALSHAINNQIGELLNYVDKLDKKLTQQQIKKVWSNINTFAVNLKKEAKGEASDYTSNHRKVLLIGIGMIIFLFLTFCGLYSYFVFVKGVKVNWKKIILENIAVFSVIGVIEAIFFMKVAAKYIPVTPDILTKTVLDRVKDRFISSLDDGKD